MPRFLTNYTLMPSGEVLTNHLIEVTDGGILLAITPLDVELAHIVYVPQPIVVLPSAIAPRLLTRLLQAPDWHARRQLLAEARLPDPKMGDRVQLYTTSTAGGPLAPLPQAAR